ncbi:PREDICTED: uncharacterized protein LOC108369764, partial [Rhagoletis zephyria]|uniref:uncharacterized protein LOC108369764 n=1 Tax=Rhagoletis zephyria TaxID=28612 RepID=UPI000811A726
MRPTFDRRLWILLYILLIQCIAITNQQNIIKPQSFHPQQVTDKDSQTVGAYAPAAPSKGWSISTAQRVTSSSSNTHTDDNKLRASQQLSAAVDEQQQQQQQTQHKCAKFSCATAAATSTNPAVEAHSPYSATLSSSYIATTSTANNAQSFMAYAEKSSQATKSNYNYNNYKQTQVEQQPSQLPSSRTRSIASEAPASRLSETLTAHAYADLPADSYGRKEDSRRKKKLTSMPFTTKVASAVAKAKLTKLSKVKEHQKVHVAHRNQHKEVRRHRAAADVEFWRAHESAQHIRWAHETSAAIKRRLRRSTDAIILLPALNFAEDANQQSFSDEELDADEDSVRVARHAVGQSNSENANALSASTTTQTEALGQEAVSSSQATSSDSSSASTAVSVSTSAAVASSSAALSTSSLEDFTFSSPASDTPHSATYRNSTTIANRHVASILKPIQYVPLKSKRARSAVSVILPAEVLRKPKEPIIIIDDVEEFDSGTDRERDLAAMATVDDKSEDYSHDEPMEPRVLPLRPVLPNPYEDEEMSVVYAEQHSEIRLMCEVDLDIASSTWYKNGQVVHAMDRTSRATDYRFIKEPNGALTITNVMLEDDGKWQCEAENSRRYTENARPVKLVVLDRPKPPYLLIDSRRLDAGNIFVPVKENSELNLACVSEGGNPKPTLTWEVLLSPGVDRHAQKVSAEVLELEEVKNDKDKNSYKINSGAKSEARLPAVYRAHHNARILCVMEHPTLKIRQNASLLLDVQYTPSFAISRTPGFGYPLREGIEVSLKCDVDSNPPSTPRWQKDDGDTPVPQTGDGFLNFTSIRHEHSGWYKCTSRHLNFQYSSIGYYLSVR